jgi:hypothetical protein
MMLGAAFIGTVEADGSDVDPLVVVGDIAA